MFGISAGFVNNQVMIPVYNAISQCSGARIHSRKSLQSKAKHTSVVAFKKSNNEAVNSENISTNEVKDPPQIVKHCQAEMKNVLTPEILRRVALYGPLLQTPLIFSRSFSHMTNRKNIWFERHSSFDSFTENKNGYSSIDSSAVDSAVRQILNNSRNKKLLSHILFDSKANFHTERSIERIKLQQMTISNKLKGVKSKPSTLPIEEESHRLNTLLMEDHSDDNQKKLKIAFAEGYLAADPKKATSKFMKYLNNFQSVLAFLTIVTLLVFLWGGLGSSMFKMQVGGNEVHPEEINVTFDDVRGVEEAKQELQEIVEFLKNPDKFTVLGAELPKGVLLVGPPGTGKTLLARAVAGEAGVPFFHAAGPEFDEVLVGQGARRVRDLFLTAKLRAPCVIFIDEIDSVGAKRSSSVLHPYANQTINQLLAEMDGFQKHEGVIVLGATNRRDDLDKALLRPGRFDVEIQVPTPDLVGRKEIFDYYLGKIKVSTQANSDVLARGTTGFTGADIKNVVNQAALRAAADQIDCVSMRHLEEARDKVLMGPEKKSRIPDEEVNLMTAYHESGHTLVSYFTKDSHPLHKVTIMPRGPSLGHTAYIPAKEQYHLTRGQMLAAMDSLMGGRAAEALIYGDNEVTSGASSDLKRATSIASHMVKDLGMSDKVGLRTFENNPNALIKSGDSLGQTTKEAIDGEIRRILQESYERALNILRTHSKEHKALAEALMKYETLDAQDIKTIIEGRPISRR